MARLKIGNGQAILGNYNSDAFEALTAKLNTLCNVMGDPGFGLYANGIQNNSAVQVSARLYENSFLYNSAIKTGILQPMVNPYMLVIDYNKNSTPIQNEIKPDENAQVHHSFYESNPNIMSIAYGQFTPIYSSFLIKPQEAVIINESPKNIPKFNKAIKASGEDKKILKHEISKVFPDNEGHYGIVIPRLNPHSFFIVGESIDDVIDGLLITISKSLSTARDSVNEWLYRRDGGIF